MALDQRTVDLAQQHELVQSLANPPGGIDPVVVVLAMAIGVSILTGCVIVLARRIQKLCVQLIIVRLATYEITQRLDGDIKDLRTSLTRAGIPIATEQRDERIRRMRLSPEARHQESLDRFNQVSAEALEHWRK